MRHATGFDIFLSVERAGATMQLCIVLTKLHL
jgi:hypothetical protein